MGKGDDRRPPAISRTEEAARWAALDWRNNDERPAECRGPRCWRDVVRQYNTSEEE